LLSASMDAKMATAILATIKPYFSAKPGNNRRPAFGSVPV
jgi:hypothetical protein